MRTLRFVALAIGILATRAPAIAQEETVAEPISNWNAPPFWSPPAKPAGDKEALGVFETEAADVVPSPPMPFVATNPCRIADTRGLGFTGQAGPPALSVGVTRVFQIGGTVPGVTTQCGIPLTAQAVSFQFSVTGMNSAGNLIAWPDGPAPTTSVLNWNASSVAIGNGIVVPLNATGGVSVQLNGNAGAITQLIIDVNGYYAPVGIVNTVNGLSGAVTLAAGSNVSITPSGQTLTIASTTPAAWSLTGNPGTTPGTNFLGTTDNQALELKVNSARVLRLESSATIGGHSSNTVTEGAGAATIAGGGQTGENNRVTDSFGTVGGGVNNQAGDGAGTTGDRISATVSGGRSNIASGLSAVVGGGFNNMATGERGTVGGGTLNVASGIRATVGGGASNQATGQDATIGGGSGNAAGTIGTVGGGVNNLTGAYGTVAGGSTNNASGISAAIGGGVGNVASGSAATIPGGSNNAATTDYSFAAGRRAKANHQGAFVWGDSTDADVSSSANNQFVARATGGFRFLLGGGVACTLDETGFDCGAPSDRTLKRDFAPVDTRETLARLVTIPIQTWSYVDHQPAVRHMGPTAQDFAASYGLGTGDKMINPLDANGVALAAIQGLYEVMREKEREIDELKARLASLEERVR